MILSDLPPDRARLFPTGVTGQNLAMTRPPPLDILAHLQQEAIHLAAREPFLAPQMEHTVLSATASTHLLGKLLGRHLAGVTAPGDAQAATRLEQLIHGILDQIPDFDDVLATDLEAIQIRDPACPGLLEAVLHFKGFHALQVHRCAHALWEHGRKTLARALANAAAAAYSVDIHPAARLGKGLLLDHGTGIVIGETAVVEDGVSLLQHVTLGGTGKEQGDRHPKVRAGVMIGASAILLGNIEIGAGSKIAAGSVVLRPVPPGCTVAGIPARVVNDPGRPDTAAAAGPPPHTPPTPFSRPHIAHGNISGRHPEGVALDAPLDVLLNFPHP